MSAILLPVVPRQPDAVAYGVDSLWLFPRLTRTGSDGGTTRNYQNLFGEQAPPWDQNLMFGTPEKPLGSIKRWFDSTLGAEDEMVTYQSFDYKNRVMVPFSMTRAQARLVNLPGLYNYPKWQPAASTALIVGPGELIPQPVQGNQIISKEDAIMIEKLLGGTDKDIQDGSMTGVFHIVWNIETRRNWLVRYRGDAWLQASLLLADMYAKGVGWPGHFDVSNRDQAVWIPDVMDVAAMDMRPEVPMPCRAFLDDEEMRQNMPGVWSVERKELTPDAKGAGGSLNASTQQQLDRIETGVNHARLDIVELYQKIVGQSPDGEKAG